MAGSPEDLETHCRAFAKRMPPAQVFSHATAASLWGLPLPYAHERPPLHVSALTGREPRTRGVIGHRIDPTRIRLGVVRGLPVVSPADAWCQMAGRLSHPDLVAAGDALLGWPVAIIPVDELDAAIERHRRGRGSRARDEARRDIRSGSASRRESLLRLEVVAAGFPEPECNAAIRLPGGATVYGDLVFRAAKVLLEYDGDHHRTDSGQFARDVGRLNALAAAGWTVLRVRTSLGTHQVLAQLAAALATRR
ncbi:DUF559 domain-containing protein [Agromyces marinus]|uniref:DUF559 domain-containing protein n=1 Tax=Agromyces marinus TaxID=1389020 RepID=A0ABN6YC45_9MICO|nr:DUF559 domain-containing protein [Agromyces marinus]UIP59961.1 hypothetical protein DSM26151_28750 [Agromyces marinus]BDZ54934.1 hypothetical protein GCM10025870_20070 [Agromyces marinus]